MKLLAEKKPGQWSSQVGISGCATWSSLLTSMSQFNDYYGTNFDDDDYHGAKVSTGQVTDVSQIAKMLIK